MFIQRRQYLKDIKRFRVSEGRDLENGLRLDRNEKVQNWESKIVKDIFDKQPDWLLSVYPDSSKIYHLISKLHKVKEENILLSSGIDGAIKTILEIMTSPGDLIGVLSPTYAMYKVYSELFQLELKEIEYSKSLKLDINSILNFLTQKPTVLFLPNPNQPIEDSLKIEELRYIAQKAEESNTLFVIDEAYHYFGADSGEELISENKNVVIARTFSKAFGVPSIRLGYILSNKENIEVFTSTRFAHESNSLSNAVAEYLLENMNIVEKYICEIIKTRNQLKSDLMNIGIKSRGETGNYLLLDLINENIARDFVEHLKLKKIYVKGPWKGRYSKYVTITLGPYSMMERFIKEAELFYINQRLK